ncbi:acyl-CoA dehydrogenase family protein [Solimonas flava]
MTAAEPLAAELANWRDTIRRFLADEMEPHYEKWEKAGIVPRERTCRS